MGRKNRSTKLEDPGKAADFKVNPFSALSAAKLDLPAEPPPKPVAPPPPPAKVPGASLSAADRDLLRAFGNATIAVGGTAPSGTAPVSAATACGRIRLQVQRKGKGGKTVTRVLGLDGLTMGEQMELARELRQALGTGAHFDEGALELHGDQRDRAAEWFRQHRYFVG